MQEKWEKKLHAPDKISANGRRRAKKTYFNYKIICTCQKKIVILRPIWFYIFKNI